MSVSNYAAQSSTATRFAPSTVSGAHVLLASREDAVVSPDGNYELVMQQDGNLVLHDLRNGGRVARWASNTSGSGADRAVMQAAGNLVVYAGSQAKWASYTTSQHAGAHLTVQNDGQAVITRLDGRPTWSSTIAVNPTTTGPAGPPTQGQLDGSDAGATTPVPPQILPGHVSEGDPVVPDADSQTVDVVTEPELDLGNVDVSLAPTEPAAPGTEQPVTVTGYPESTAAAAGAEVLLKVEPAVGGTSPDGVMVEVALDDLAGTADWDSRATVYQMPACAATTPATPSCRTMTPVTTGFVGTGDGGGGSVISSSVSVSSQSVLAIASKPSGPAGSWAATPLAPAASWRLAENTGDFSWSYPFEVPGLEDVPGVSLGLSYSSGSLDGRTSGTNNQASWVGDGFEMSPGYVERTFVTCRDDRTGGNNATRATGDLCWQSSGGRVVEDVQIVLEGRATRVIKDATTGIWRLMEDDGSRFERLTGAPNGAQNGEHFKLTTTDGTQYFFGLTRRPGGPTGDDTKSTWTVPVYGNQSGEPCFQSGNFGGSSCAQGWRWNLDYVVDVDGDTSSLFYEREDNRYGANNTPTTPVTYTRGGWLSRVEYGGRSGSETSPAPARMSLTVAERCESWGANTCQPAQLTKATKDRWPDVLFDLLCTTGTSCAVSSPTFFTRKKLTEVQSEVYTSGAYRAVDRWALTHQFPNSGEGSAVAPALWLQQIQRTAMDPDPAKRITLPPVQFQGTQLPNRIDALGDGAFALFRYRITDIVTETGGQIQVEYSGTTTDPTDDPLCDAPTTATPAPARPNPSSNTSRCFPSLYTIEGQTEPTVHWFHKYLVDKVTARDVHNTSASTQTSYAYEGGGAWAYSSSETTAPKYRTWNQWRGYSSVLTTTGDPAGEAPLKTRTYYLRGMHGDYLAPGQTRSVTVTIDDPERAAAADPTYVDDPRFAGYVPASITYNGAEVVTMAINEAPWKSPATATSVNAAVGSAYFIGEAATRTLTRTAAGGWQRVEAFTTFDNATGRPTQVHDAGDAATAADDTCTRYTYVDNTTKWLRNVVSRTETFAGTCASPGARLRGEQIYYDGATSLTTSPTRGLATRVEQLDGATPAAATYRVVATAAYDSHGRQVSATRDPSGVNSTTSVAYTPAAGWPVTKVQTTNAVGHVSSVDVDPVRQVVTRSTDVRGAVTTLRYDAMGRLTGVWAPDRSTSGRASTEYAYSVTATRPPSVETRSLVVAGTRTERYVSSFAFFDGLLRPVQTQSPDARGVTGRVVTDTRYDSRGLVVEQAGPYAERDNPSGAIVNVGSNTVPSVSRMSYDGAGRAVRESFLVEGVERWSTVTGYAGDSVTTTQTSGPASARVAMVNRPAVRVFTDATGQVTRQRTFRGAAASGAYDDLTYAYSSVGELLSLTDQGGNRWVWEYDVRGRQVRSVDPDRGTSTVAYDNAGRATSTTDARGVTVSMAYDKVDRATQRSSGGVTLASWTYDDAGVANSEGLLTQSRRFVASGGSTVEYTRGVSAFDALGRPVETFVTVPGSEGSLAGSFEWSTRYNAAGGVAGGSSPATPGMAAETRSMIFNPVGLVESVSGVLAQADYTAYGEVARSLVSMTAAGMCRRSRLLRWALTG